MWSILKISYKYHILFASLLRIILVIYSEFHDKIAEVPYTDIDYKVFTDASRHILNYKSPYDRHTYRYTPLIAILLIPNILLHPCFGKIVFSVIDIAVGLLIRTIVSHNRKIFTKHEKFTNKNKSVNISSVKNNESKVRNRKKIKDKDTKTTKGKSKIVVDNFDYTADYCMLFWIYNPMTFIISTRGNCDSFAVFLVLLTIYFLQCKEQYFLAGLAHGLAVHVRLYPMIYSLSLFMYLSKFGLYSTDKKVTHSSAQFALLSKQIQQKEILSGSPKQLNLAKNERKTIFKKDYLMYLIPNIDQISLICGTVLSLISLTIVFYYFYGYEFLYETYLYHLVRKDTRHNFSMFFYIQYLTAGIKNIGIWQRVLSFLPQIVLILVLSVRYGLNKFTLPFSILTQTIVMVSYNSVVTSQYFIWILAVLPLSLWQFKMSFRNAITLLAIWFAAQVAWLFPAYLLEFHGQNTFLYIWLQGVSFFCANMAILGRLIKCYMYKCEECTCMINCL